MAWKNYVLKDRVAGVEKFFHNLADLHLYIKNNHTDLDKIECFQKNNIILVREILDSYTPIKIS